MRSSSRAARRWPWPLGGLAILAAALMSSTASAAPGSEATAAATTTPEDASRGAPLLVRAVDRRIRVEVFRDEICVVTMGHTSNCHAHQVGAPEHLAVALGEELRAAVVGEAGLLVHRADGAWETWTLPTPTGSWRAVTVDAVGQITLIDDAVVVRCEDGNCAVSSKLPRDARGQVLAAAAVGGSGGAYISGTRGRLWRVGKRGSARLIAYGGLTPQVMAGDWDALWWSEGTRRLYARVSSGQLVVFSPEREVADAIPAPTARSETVTSGPTSGVLWGYDAGAGARIWMSSATSLFSLVGDRLVWRGEIGEEITALWPGADGVDVWVRTVSGAILRVDGTQRRAQTTVALTPREEERLARAASPRRASVWFSKGRLVPSLGVRIGGLRSLGSSESAGTFVTELGGGVLIAPWQATDQRASVWLWPRLGYRMGVRAGEWTHGVYGDVGIGGGGTWWMVVALGGIGITPRRTTTETTARLGVGGYTLWGTLGVELRAEEISAGGRGRAQLGGLLNVNLAPWIWLAGTLRER